MKPRNAVLVTSAALALGACAPQDQDPRLTGLGVGAATGAAAGQVLGGDTRSTVAGAGIGALGGGIIGAEQAHREGRIQ
jgi:uncharacterized protein YcfJ